MQSPLAWFDSDSVEMLMVAQYEYIYYYHIKSDRDHPEKNLVCLVLPEGKGKRGKGNYAILAKNRQIRRSSFDQCLARSDNNWLRS